MGQRYCWERSYQISDYKALYTVKNYKENIAETSPGQSRNGRLLYIQHKSYPRDIPQKLVHAQINAEGTISEMQLPANNRELHLSRKMRRRTVFISFRLIDTRG